VRLLLAGVVLIEVIRRRSKQSWVFQSKGQDDVALVAKQ